MSQEIILSACSSLPSSATSHRPASSSTPAIHLHDLTTASSLHAFKTSVSGKGGLSFVNSRQGRGGTVWAVQEDKALVAVWAWQKDQQHLKLHLPEKISAISLSPNGIWLAAGSPTGQLYLWEISSGLLLASINAHYRAISSLKFSPDSHLLITASSDTSAHIFLVSRLVDDEQSVATGGGQSSGVGRPYGTLADHTLGITDVRLGLGGSGGGRCWTASEDGTIKVWSLHPPFDLLATFALPASAVPTSIAVDTSERFVYAACSNGEVFHLPMFRPKPESNLGLSAVEEAIGGGGIGAPPALKLKQGVISLNPKTQGSPTSLTLSMASSQLIIGTSTGDILVYDLPSHQLVKTISVHPGPVTHVSTMLRPADLVGHSVGMSTLGTAGSSSNSSSVFNGASSYGLARSGASKHNSTRGGGAGGSGDVVEWSVMDIRQPERMRNPKVVKESHTASIALRPSVSSFQRIDKLRRPGKLAYTGIRIDDSTTIGTNLTGRSIGATLGVSASIGGDVVGVESERKGEEERVALVEENKRLRAALDRAVKINEKMWESVVDIKLVSKAAESGESD